MGSKGTCLDHMRSIACGFRCLSVPFSKCMPWDFLLCFSILTLESSSFLCHYFQDGCHESRILSSQPTLHARRRGWPLQYLFTFHKEAKLPTSCSSVDLQVRAGSHDHPLLKRQLLRAFLLE